MKVYLVQTYTFYKSNGKDIQAANCGTTPYIFTAKYKAERFFEELRERYGASKHEVQLFPYTSFETKRQIGEYEYRDVVTLQEVETN